MATIGVVEVAVGDHHRRRRGGQHVEGGGGRGVGAVDHHPELVAAGHHRSAEVGEPSVDRRLGLDVAELVHPVVHQGERRHAEGVGRRQALEVALEEVGPLAGEEHSRLAGVVGPLHLGRRPGQWRLGAVQHLQQAGELPVVIGAGLPRGEGPSCVQATVGCGGQHGEVGNRRHADRRHPGGPRRDEARGQRVRPQQLHQQVVVSQAGEEAPAGVGVDVDPGTGSGCHGRTLRRVRA